jgi:catechol 2,3-dioxygenase-like lactoylglutathione lyase family enzyme
MNVQFVTSIAPIVRDTDASRSFYRDTLGLSFEGQEGDYVFTHELEGTKHIVPRESKEKEATDPRSSTLLIVPSCN